MALCRSSWDCNDHGDCLDGICRCDFTWFGINCKASGMEEWGYLWVAYVCIAACFYFLLAAYAALKLLHVCRGERMKGGWRVFRRAVRSPKYRSLTLLTLIGLLRGVWLVVDPHRFRGWVNLLGDRLLYLSCSPLLFCLYCSIILIWNGMCQGIGLGDAGLNKSVRFIIYVEMTLSFPLLLTLSLDEGLRLNFPGVKWAVFALSSAGVMFIIALLIMYAVIIHRYIKVSNCADDTEAQIIEESTTLRNSQQCSPGVHGSPSFIEIPSFSQDNLGTLQTNAVEIDMRCDVSEESNDHKMEDSSWSVSDSHPFAKQELTTVSRSADDQVHFWSNYHSREHSVIFTRNDVESPSNRTDRRRHSLVLVLTKEDKLILRQIMMLTALSGLIGVTGIAVAVLCNSISLQEKMTFAAIVIDFVMEIFACAIVRITQVLFVFTTEIRVECKQNLQFVAEVRHRKLSLKFKKHPPKLRLPDKLPMITKRLQAYVGI